MKNENIEESIIIYDDYCPMCDIYTNAFIKTGFLTKNGRQSFSTIDSTLLEKIDLERSKHEIPYLNTTTGQVWYGIDALLEILNKKIPFIKAIGNLKPIRYFLLKLYKLISYNRKVIVAKKTNQNCYDCSPNFNAFYRILYLILALSINSLLLIPLFNIVFSKMDIFKLNIFQFEAYHFALVAINLIIAVNLSFKNGIDYLGQVATLSIQGMLVWLPSIIIFAITQQLPLIILYLNLVLGTLFLLFDYLRRMKYLEIYPTKKWIIVINLISLILFFLVMFVF